MFFIFSFVELSTENSASSYSTSVFCGVYARQQNPS